MLANGKREIAKAIGVRFFIDFLKSKLAAFEKGIDKRTHCKRNRQT
jgi:hypothetical protein